mgnify:CR=1 FL=1
MEKTQPAPKPAKPIRVDLALVERGLCEPLPCLRHPRAEAHRVDRVGQRLLSLGIDRRRRLVEQQQRRLLV